jgi:hypothetical protein
MTALELAQRISVAVFAASIFPEGTLDLVLVGGGGAAGVGLLWAILRKAVKEAGASGWRVTLSFARVDLAALERESAAAKARAEAEIAEVRATLERESSEAKAAKAKAEAVVKEAENRVRQADALALQCRAHLEQTADQRDELALRLAGVK